MSEILPYLERISLVTLTAFMLWFVWWKSQLYKELVEPHINLMKKDIERSNARLTKLEFRADNFTNTTDARFSEIKQEISEIKEILANLNGKFEMFMKGKAE